jgi:hypothetical protein
VEALLMSSVASGEAQQVVELVRVPRGRLERALDVGDRVGIEQVEGDRHDARVLADRGGVAGERVDLRRPALEQLVDEVAAEAARCAGDDRRGGGEIHAENRTSGQTPWK